MDPKPTNVDDELGEFEPVPKSTDEAPPRTCNLDDGPCESCQ